MYEQVKQLLIDELGIDERLISPSAELVGDLDINSIELADLVMVCEEQFDIEMAEEDLTGLVTVGDVVDYLENHVN